MLLNSIECFLYVNLLSCVIIIPNVYANFQFYYYFLNSIQGNDVFYLVAMTWISDHYIYNNAVTNNQQIKELSNIGGLGIVLPSI